jgi:hypothetical protein
MEPVLDWEARYQETSVPWERDGLNPAFTAWQPWLETQKGTVLIPGCGRSPELLAFADLDFRVIGIDLAESAVRFQRSALTQSSGDNEVIVTNLFDWLPETPVDIIYEQTCLCALKPEHWSAYETQLTQWLRPGGNLLGLFMQTGEGGGPPFHCDLDAMGDLFASERWIWHPVPVRSEHPLGVHELGYRLTLR